MTENMVLNWEKASANSEGRLAQILTQLVSALELHGRSIVKLEANVASLTEQVTQQVGYIDGLKIIMRPETDAGSDMADLRARVTALEHRDPDPDMTMDPQLTKFSEAVMGVINHNAETIAESVWEEIESKVDDAVNCMADHAFDYIDAADIVRKGLKEIL